MVEDVGGAASSIACNETDGDKNNNTNLNT